MSKKLPPDHISQSFDIQNLKALIFDVDGTLVRGGKPLPGLTELFSFLNEKDIICTIASNNSTNPPQQYYDRLKILGVNIPLEHILTSAIAASAYLREIYSPGSTIFMIGQQGLFEALNKAGYRVIEDFTERARAVIIGGDYELTYNKLKDAVLHIQHGAKFIGTNPDIVFPTEEGMVPECGTTLAAVEAATGVSPLVIGKPGATLFRMAMEIMGSDPRSTAIVGDRLDSDIIGGKRAGIATILIKTGIDNEETIVSKGIIPDLVVEDLCDLLERLSNCSQGVHRIR